LHRAARIGEIYDRENELVILPPFTLREASENTKALSVSALLNGERPRTVTDNIFLAKSSTTNCRVPMPRHVPHRNSSIPTI
jgi:hypothetical protein